MKTTLKACGHGQHFDAMLAYGPPDYTPPPLHIALLLTRIAPNHTCAHLQPQAQRRSPCKATTYYSAFANCIVVVEDGPLPRCAALKPLPQDEDRTKACPVCRWGATGWYQGQGQGNSCALASS